MRFILSVFWGFLGICVLVLLGLLVGPGFVDWSRHKPFIEDQLTGFVGREVRIGGDVSFYALPVPLVRVEQMTVASVPQARGGPLLQVAAGEARLALASLLQGKIGVAHLTLIKPVLTLELHTGIKGLFARPLSVAHESVELDSFVIEGGMLRIIDYKTNRFFAFHSLDANIEMESLLGPFRAQGALVYKEVPWNFDVNAGQFVENKGLSLSLGVSRETVGGHFSGRVSSQGQVFGVVRLKLQTAEDFVGVPYPVDLESRVVGSFEGVELRDLKLTMGSVVAKGMVQWQGWDRPVTVQLSGRGLDLDELLEKSSVRWGGGLEFGLALDSVLYRGDVVEALRLSGGLHKGELSHLTVRARLPGNGDFFLDGRKEESVFRGRVSVKGPAFRPVVVWALGEGAFVQELLRLPETLSARFALDSTVVVAPQHMSLKDIRGTIDDVRLTGTVLFGKDSSVPLKITAHLGDVDADKYGSVLGLALHWDAPPAEVFLTAQTVSYSSHVAQDITTRLTVDSKNLRLLSLEVEDFLGARFALKGDMRFGSSPTGFLEGEVEARAPEAFLTFLDAGLSKTQRRAMRPLHMQGRLMLGDHKKAELFLQGHLGDSRVRLEGTLSPFEDLEAGWIEGTLQVENPQASILVRQLGLPEVLSARAPGQFSLSLKGTLDDFMEAETALTVGTVRHFFKGQTRLSSDELHWRRITGELAGVAFTSEGSYLTTFGRGFFKGRIFAKHVPYGFVGWLQEMSRQGDVFALARLRDFDAEVHVRAQTLALGITTLQDLDMVLSLDAGRLRVEPRAFMGDGTLDGTVDINVGRAAASGSATLSLQGVTFTPLPMVEGVAELTVSLEGRGDSFSAVLSSLSGRGHLALQNGELRGWTLSTFAEGVAEIHSGHQLDALLLKTKGGATPFRTMQGRFSVTKGVFSMPQGTFASEAGDGNAKIFWDVPRGRMDAELILRAHGHRLSLLVVGDLENPQVSLDADLLRATLSQYPR